MIDQTTARHARRKRTPSDNLRRYEILCLITDQFKKNRGPKGAKAMARATGWSLKLSAARLQRMADLGFLHSGRHHASGTTLYWLKPPTPLEVTDVC